MAGPRARGRKSKFGNSWTTVDGIKFQSKLEAKRYIQLKQLLNDQKIKSFTRQPKFDLIAGIRYVGDFEVTGLDDKVWIEDVKGMETEAFKLKQKLFNHFHSAKYGNLVVIKAKDMKGVRLGN